MRKFISLIFALSLTLNILGCGPKEKSAIAIGKIKITADEFNSAFNKSTFAKSETKESRREFLPILIDRKLILREAQKEGLDREAKFLENVQFFWEQSLMNLTLNKKINQLAAQISVSDQEVKDHYEKHKEAFSGKNLSEAYEEIKLELFRKKQNKALDDWINSLNKTNEIKIDYKLLGLE